MALAPVKLFRNNHEATIDGLFAMGGAFALDSMPLPVCKRVRARHHRKIDRRDHCGYCAVKSEKILRLALASNPYQHYF